MAQPAATRILLAKTFIAEGRATEAAQELDVVLAEEPTNPDALAP